ncbi:MAG: bifunctional lysylphosphatidylglycerol flippase/synthetase MprF [Phycisphaerales bacterium]|nr:bifunctional lysylphosphatidylglycerol flippase/synthetase MprF [Phycisphaerales bacterium]MCB9863187.1 bifunctional lysylphosphatidylglycerol flippase/synthetase MprF [Phycisphaerales bacterium]
MFIDRHRAFRLLGPLLAVVMFAGALWVLHDELRHVRYHDLIKQVGLIPGRRIGLALALTFLSYLTLTGYDALGFLYLKRKLAYYRIGMASFLGYAFSHNLGFAALTGPAIRYRVYSAWGLTAFDVAKLFALCGATFWLGYLALSGAAFLIEPLSLPDAFHLSSIPLRPLGALLIGLLAFYLYWTGVRKRDLKLHSWVFPAPALHLSIIGVILSCIDWTLAGAVLYVLLPPAKGLAFSTFMSMFLLAQLVALVCHVPGGIGVFESLMLIFLKSHLDSSAILGILLVYRCIYYLFPLGVATLLLAGHEAFRRRSIMIRLFGALETWASPLVPNLLAIAMFLCGTVLLLSGATPATEDRLHWLRTVIPLPAVEASHFIGSVIGTTLVILARAIQRRSSAAYFVAAGLLAVGIVSSLIKGLDYEEAIVLTIAILALVPCRRHFYRHASVFHQPFSAGWIAAVAIALLCTLWLCFFSYKHVDYNQELWWHFSFRGDAPRSMRALVGITAVLLFFVFARLLGPGRQRPQLPGPDELRIALPIIRMSPNTDANLALLGDKSLLFNDEKDAFIMYGVSGRSWIALGDPVGPASRQRDLAWNFHELCDAHGGTTVFYEVSNTCLPHYLEMGLGIAKVGEDAHVALADFTLEGSAHKELRQVRNRLTKDGCALTIAPATDVEALLPELRRVSDAWLMEKHTREKGFSLGFFDESYLSQFPIALLHRHNSLVAFANLWQAAEKEELSIDLMRYAPDAPSGVMDFLFSELMLWGKAEGYRRFNLGMAPLAGLDHHPLSPVWNKIGNAIFRHGEHFYNFRGLRQYKAKFNPEWRPRYLAHPGGLALPGILLDLGSLTSGGIKGIVGK